MRRRAVEATFGMCGAILLLLALSGAGEPSGALPACPGAAPTAEKPGAPPSPETRFFQELQRLDGLLVRGEILQGCLLNGRFRFEVETGRGRERWEAPAGEVVGICPLRVRALGCWCGRRRASSCGRGAWRPPCGCA